MKIPPISALTAHPDFNLACRRTLHSCEQDTPGEHEHCFYELAVVYSGSGVHRMDGREAEISSGSVLLIPPHRKHWYVKFRNLELFNLVFARQFFRYFPTDLTQLPGYQLIFNVDARQFASAPDDGIRIDAEAFPEIISVLTEMDRMNHEVKPGNKCLLISDFLRVILLISRHAHWSGGRSGSQHVGALTRLLSRLEDRCTEEWNLPYMAKSVNMSISGFCHEFRKLTGDSPVQYLLKLRLARAVFLMETTDLPLEEIALECGFSDRSYFSRQFLKQYRIRPSHYREELPRRMQNPIRPQGE